MQRLVAALIASNVVLALVILYPNLTKRIRALFLGKRPSALPAGRARAGSLTSYLGKDYEPPLPKPVADALERSCLCFLATADLSSSPHLSLMRFTYTASLEDTQSEVLIISTQRNTKKYEIITANQNVALLVHDFVAEQAHDATNNQKLQGQTRYSITLNGVVKEQHNELAEKYRAIHLASNSEYSQFIVGDDIAIITVNLKRARVCDVNDRVTHFAKAESGKEWEEFPPKS